MQNKAKFRKVNMNVNRVLTMNYEQLDTWSIRKKQSQTNPNKAKTNPILANKTLKQTQFKPKQTQFQMKNAVALNDKHSAGCREVYDKHVDMHPFSVVFRYSNMYIYFFQLYCKHLKQLN
jgi:hypothetical protein